MTLANQLLQTHAARATILIRILVGGVFLTEGIQKFLLPAALGAGRFAGIGIPAPQVMAPFVGVVEIVCGSLLLLGLGTRVAAIPLLINISVAILSTKIPILLGHDFGTFTLPKLARYGFWSALHEGRTDLSMLLGLIFLLIVGGGAASLDTLLTRTRSPRAGVDASA
ncbi:DoxX family protein [uncultured Thiodictyon sp.]|uniref:DoxX family protein n=1 Tax=uncultured Thiodictyon sp. TaxID=1846217 RepID=UPI0025D355C0|nr:DoxX family protein [uncultured Thiodictyon sp.]